MSDGRNAQALVGTEYRVARHTLQQLLHLGQQTRHRFHIRQKRAPRQIAVAVASVRQRNRIERDGGFGMSLMRTGIPIADKQRTLAVHETFARAIAMEQNKLLWAAVSNPVLFGCITTKVICPQ